MLALIFLTLNSLSAQDVRSKLTAEILKLDSLFWNAYNTCDLETMGNLMTDDVEFYHDKGGMTSGAATLMESIKDNLCNDENFHLRREAVPGTVEVFPMDNFGAIISGEHVFYVNQAGNPEFLDGLAKFTHLIKEVNGKYLISRVLSYDHGPAPHNEDKTIISLSTEQLMKFEGNYQIFSSDQVSITVASGNLHLDAGEMKADLFPQSSHIFFHREAPLTFEFIETDGEVIEMIVRENHKVVDLAKKLN